jgi:soluble cytochrome b562
MNRQKVELSPSLQRAGRTVYNAGRTVYNAGKTVVNAAKTAVNDSVTTLKKIMKDREDATRAAREAADNERKLTKRALYNMSTKLENKYTETPEEKSYKAKQGMQNLQNRVYEREQNRRREQNGNRRR